MTRQRRIIVAGGGTGGHLFPGIAVVEELRRRLGEVDVLFVGTERGIEARVIPERGEKLELLEVSPLKGRSPVELFKSMARLPGAVARAASVVRDHEADLVIGVGGYASGPVLAAASAAGIPTAVLEQNAHVGLTNRMLAPMVGRAYLTFDETAERFGAKARVVGNPVRRDFVEASRRAAADPDGFEARAKTILVIGGSQGAQALNEKVPSAMAKLDPSRFGLRVIHQTGAAMKDEVQRRYDALGVDAEVVSFIDDMAKAYGEAALVVARAGATTLAEICAVGRPSILVPYPYAADDHQAKNAKSLERDGAAQCILQSDLRVDGLAQSLVAILEDPTKRRDMAEAARRRGRPDAAASIVDDLCDWLGWPAFTTDSRRPAPPTTGNPSPNPGDEKPTQRATLRAPGYDPVWLNRASNPQPRRRLIFQGTPAWGTP